MPHSTADIGSVNYAVTLVAGHHPLTADEGLEAGGKDQGPTPHELLCAALGACTAITLRMYAAHKQWALRGLHVDVRLQIEGTQRTITRQVHLDGELDVSQRTRLAEVAEHTPVTLTLKQGVAIRTTLD